MNLNYVKRCAVSAGVGTGSPMMVRVINPAGQMSLVMVGADAPVPVGQPVVAVINTQGVSINAADICATAKGLCSLSKCKKPSYVLQTDNITHNYFELCIICSALWSKFTDYCLSVNYRYCLFAVFLFCSARCLCKIIVHII